ncbi:mandelate racemase/muconate lactonizing enzyme family protein [Carboxydochorda subterranea]|uniref:Mandelate racemase/muconate lactonizing enzyme family protein n=1 Tax=Carboxydichorda subterranea TaxID=3109565 RepID=A0ABZ1BVC2_9FIRM|nr:mandelate racemase/muconate lactonizing enzyme family protein [Limnochorda sp. L945t]WRP16598.1 mandelate racemase/muconate lactonizing enzyme family protein [Limnochorda sp. L945t]
MKITDIRTAVVEGNFDWVLVRVDTDADVSGLGEAYWGAGVAELVEKAKRFALGEDPRDVNKIVDKMIRGLSGEGSLAGTTVTAVSGIEIALWDLMGKVTRLPVYRLLGGNYRDKVRVYCDLHAGQKYEDTASFVERARHAIDMGFTAIKFDIDLPNPFNPEGTTDPELSWFMPYNRTLTPREIKWIEGIVRAVRSAVGDDADLLIDCHWKFNVSDALALARALEPYGLYWLEDPVPPENIDALAKVSAGTTIPIATGENLYRAHGFLKLISQQACSIVTPDIPKMGGLREARRVAELADLYYMGIAPHNVCSPIGTMAAAHAGASVPNFLVLEWHAIDVPWWADMVTSKVIEGGYIRVPERPGIGLELNEDVVKAHLKPGSTFFGE